MENVYDFVDESRNPPLAELCVEFGKSTRTQNSRTPRVCSTLLPKLVKEHSEEILNVKCLEYSSPSWAVLAFEQAINWTKAKVCVYADSVLCVGQMKTHSRSSRKMERRSGRTQVVFVSPRCSRYRWRSNWIRVELLPGNSSLSILEEIQQDLEKRKIQPEEFTDRIISMSMLNDIEWKSNDENCISNAEKVKNYAMKFSQGHWTFLGPGSGEKWYGCSNHAQKRAMELYSRQNGATFQRNWSSCIQKYECLE